jgi:hypothetical protein
MEVGKEEMRIIIQLHYWKSFSNELLGFNLVFRVPRYFFTRKWRDIELKNWEMVAGERQLTRYGEAGQTVRKMVCVEGAWQKLARSIAVASLDSGRALYVGGTTVEDNEELEELEELDGL